MTNHIPYPVGRRVLCVTKDGKPLWSGRVIGRTDGGDYLEVRSWRFWVWPQVTWHHRSLVHIV